MVNSQLLAGWYWMSKVQFSEYGSLLAISYPPNSNGLEPSIVDARLGSDARTVAGLLGGGAGAVAPNGFAIVEPFTAVRRDTNGGSKVTPKGPLKPPPALGDNSVKYSPRS